MDGDGADSSDGVVSPSRRNRTVMHGPDTGLVCVPPVCPLCAPAHAPISIPIPIPLSPSLSLSLCHACVPALHHDGDRHCR